MKKNNYIGRVLGYCMVIMRTKFSFLLKAIFLLMIICAFTIIQAKAVVIDDGGTDVNPLAYDEIPVRVLVEGYKMFYLDAIYTNNKLLYVNIEDLFRTLDIACSVDQVSNRLNGFIENESKTYSVDYTTGQLRIGDKSFNTPKGLVKEAGSYFVESSLFTEAFGINLNFNYRAMTITLKPTFELPVIKQMRIEKMRNNMVKLQGGEIADTILRRNYHLFKFGTGDWLLTAAKLWNGSADNHVALGVGTELLYGEADVSVNYYSLYKFDSRQVQYIWRWVDNENKIIKQAQVGKIATQTISFINNQVVGAVVRNSPTTVRKASGYYTISEVTDPNWTIELYINNVLVNYTQADASGSYTFKVPIVYGYTTLKLKFYGPLGEERTEERTMNVPYTVMPVNEFEYSVSAGVVQDSSNSRFGRADFNYGVSRLLTVGGGLEYLSSIMSGAYIPFAKATLQPISNLTLNAEYAYGVRTRGLLNYSFGKNAVLELDYAKYVEGQRATLSNANVERKIRLSLPFRYKKINGFLKLDYSQLVYKEFTYNQGSAMVSVYYNQFSANSSMLLNWIDNKTPYIINETSLSYRTRNGFTFRPSARYNVSENSVMSCKAEIEKRISKVYLSVSYEHYFTYNDHYVNLSFRYDLPFARVGASFAQSKNKVMTSENAHGSMEFGGDKYTNFSNNSSVSKGGILLYPFLDLNRNGVFDKGEQMVKLNSVIISGGKAIFSEKDSIVRIPDLNAFTNYILEFKDDDLETISWRFKHKIYSILVDPNQFKRVDIPVLSVGEVSGMTYIDKNNELKGLGRIILKLYDKSSNREIAQTLSESDGYVYYLGLEPGDYVACVDSVQLGNLGLTVDPPCREFTIKTSENGDIVSGLDFILRPVEEELLQSQNKAQEPVVVSSANVNSLAFVDSTSEKLNKQKEAVTQEIDTIAKLTDTTSLPVKTIPVESVVAEKPVTPETEKVVPQTDTSSLPVKTIPAKSVVAEKPVTPETEKVVPQTDTNSLPVKTIPAESVVAEKPVTPETEKVGPLTGTVSLPAKTNPESTAIEKKIKVQDTVKVTLPAPLHRIDQQSSDSKIHASFASGDTLFKVQLLALPKPLKDKNYFTKLMAAVPGLTIEETLGEDGLYHYSTKTFKGISEAAKYQRMIRKSGWKDSFVAKYAGERRTETTFRRKLEKSGKENKTNVPVEQITVSQQQKEVPENEKVILKGKISVEPNNIQQAAKPYSDLHYGEITRAEREPVPGGQGDTLYQVQLLALRTSIRIDTYFALLFSKMPGLQIEESQGDDGLYRYKTKPFARKQEALDFEQKIRNNGWIDCFIATYISGRRH